MLKSELINLLSELPEEEVKIIATKGMVLDLSKVGDVSLKEDFVINQKNKKTFIALVAEFEQTVDARYNLNVNKKL